MPKEQEKWSGGSKASQSGYKIFIWLLRTCGASAAYGLLHFVSLYYLLFVPSATRPIWQLYRQRLGFSPWKSFVLLRKNIFIFGQTLIDKIIVLAGISNKLTFEHEGVQNLEDMVAAGKGGLLVSAHLGNWEVAGHLLKRLDTTINILMYDGED